MAAFFESYGVRVAALILTVFVVIMIIANLPSVIHSTPPDRSPQCEGVGRFVYVPRAMMLDTCTGDLWRADRPGPEWEPYKFIPSTGADTLRLLKS